MKKLLMLGTSYGTCRSNDGCMRKTEGATEDDFGSRHSPVPNALLVNEDAWGNVATFLLNSLDAEV